MELPNSFISIDTFTCDAFLADARGTALPLYDDSMPADATSAVSSVPAESPGVWTDQFARALQVQHTRVREFLQTQRDRWRQLAANFTRQIESLQAEIQALHATNEELRTELQAQAAEGDPRAGNAGFHRQAAEDQSESAAASASPSASNSDWAAQKRRILAELESDDQRGDDAREQRSKVEEIVARTDRIIAEKDREIDELRHLLNSQSSSLGSIALGAAALEQVLDQDAIVREERQRLQQLQEECRAKQRQVEIELAVERARLARRDAELEEKARNAEPRRAAAGGNTETEALAPTGRPVRGRWRAQLGLTDDGPPDFDRSRERR